MKQNDRFVPKALQEVWAWKEAIYNDVKHLPVEKALAAILDSAQKLSPPAKRSRQFRPTKASRQRQAST